MIVSTAPMQMLPMLVAVCLLLVLSRAGMCVGEADIAGRSCVDTSNTYFFTGCTDCITVSSFLISCFLFQIFISCISLIFISLLKNTLYCEIFSTRVFLCDNN
jgi:hypothetical protein